YIISPFFNIPSDDYVLTFDAALLKYGQTPDGTPPLQTNTDDQFAILIGDGFTWSTANIVREYNNSGSEYLLHDIPVYGETISIPLTGHIGHIRIAFFAGSLENNDDNDIMINDFFVGIPSAQPEAPLASISTDISTGLPLLSWDAVPNATIYHIYKTNDPTLDYLFFQSTSGTTYLLDPAEEKAFFKITAE
ncbi:MAG: hypothetical protein M0Q16_09025, partial [Candidatus Cloacimonetes bacterium]|nr:hypothetical protein [Candidatus Cloacimonadota bacterium]MCK9185499.1 hypothetical protein [Candidatus Cloacimonadota bacterium]